ncbi:carboxynorspermidine decarboxylase [Sphingorhabdus lutea]|uniref:Carboxynorspermidine/carboxyspermidine decarboxylase n=1 Tax=Sphingorhabdus lutea TaxID=1913578 RepID=A0A1L3JC14_9SPHN|nr:carboxynorspermidine decarboxylase [Sphingorhabdus lutea]APG62639.1 carboxynorspermidine decarboxylase [Sphingorhabdus lutea]
METKAGDPGAFAHFDLGRVDSPSFIVDAAAIRRNLSILADVKNHSGAKILCAMKAFSMWQLAPLIGEYLDGVCTSGLWEARLAREHYKGEIATYCAGYKQSDMAEIVEISDHIIFNSPAQHRRFVHFLTDKVDAGLRINPQHSEGEVEKYDPCQPHSRLGFPIGQLKTEHLSGISGIHFHTLCEQEFAPLERTWEAIKPILAPYFNQLKWINFGGGHHITRDDYDREALIHFIRKVSEETGCVIYLEPGEAIALDAGILVGEILDIFDNGMPVGICDISATCHMPDVIEAPYRPAMLGEKMDGPVMRLGGPSCLAGDIIGDYRFAETPQIGQRFAFLDQAHYSMVKTTTFNGVPLPSIWLWDSESDDLKLVKRFEWTDFKNRLS